MRKIFTKNRNLSLTLILWVFLFTFAVALFIDDAMRNKRLPAHPYVTASQPIQRKLEENTQKSASRLFVYFIDCLRFDYAIHPKKMPFLHSLLSKGTWGKVTPCATNMTVHCVEATFSGRDRSSILSFSEDFHPRASKSKKTWMYQMATRGHKIDVVGDHVFKSLYGALLNKMHEYKKGASQLKLTRKALRWFDDPSVSVSIVHLLGPHDIGQAYGTVGPRYHAQLKETDDILKEVVARLKPTDSLLVYGDHGINDVGQHTYNTDTPTFYLYKGPKFARGKRFDMNIASHAFWLNTLFEIPFNDEYQGEVYWEGLTAEAKKPYGDSQLFALRRTQKQATVKLRPMQIGILVVLFLLIVLGFIFRYDGIRDVKWWHWALGLLPLVALFLLDKFWLLPFVFAIPSLALITKRPSRGALIFTGALIAFAFARAILYRPLDLLIHDAKIYFVYSLYIVEAAIAFGIAHVTNKKESLATKIGLGALFYGLLLLTFHYPTLYFYGVIRGIPFFLIVIMSGFTLSAIMDREHPLSPLEKGIFGVTLLISIAFLATQISMFVENFRLFYFKYLPTGDAPLTVIWAFTPYVVASAILIRLASVKGALRLSLLGVACVVAMVLASGFIPLHPRLYLGLFVVILALWFIPFREFMGVPKHIVLWFIMIPELGYMHQFDHGAFYQITGLGMVAGLLNMVVRSDNHQVNRWKLAMPYILMGILVMVVAFGFRTNGIDYKFAIKWFPRLFERLWFVIFTADMIKYFMGLLFISLFFPPNSKETFRLAGNLLVTIQLSLGAFLLMLFLVEDKIPLVVDSLEETVYMMGLILFSGMLYLLFPFIKPEPRRG